MIPEKHTPARTIGAMNLAAAQAALRAHRIRFQVLESGGTQACTLVVDCELLTVTAGRIDAVTAK